jgi:hypothetical protein
MVGFCDVCGRRSESLCCHEIVQGNRVKAYTEPAVILVVCGTTIRGTGCHELLHAYPLEWSAERCLALLYLRRSSSYSLAKFNELSVRKVCQEDVDDMVQILVGQA